MIKQKICFHNIQYYLQNIEGRIDTYEEYGKNSSISLRVKRTIGLLGTVTVSWEAETKEASFSDFQPPSGSVTLMDGEESGQITITILDDTIAEEMEVLNIIFQFFLYT